MNWVGRFPRWFLRWVLPFLCVGCVDSTVTPPPHEGLVRLRFQCRWLGVVEVLDGWILVDEDQLRGRDPEYYTGEIECKDGGLIKGVACTDRDAPGLVCKIKEADDLDAKDS